MIAKLCPFKQSVYVGTFVPQIGGPAGARAHVAVLPEGLRLSDLVSIGLVRTNRWDSVCCGRGVTSDNTNTPLFLPPLTSIFVRLLLFFSFITFSFPISFFLPYQMLSLHSLRLLNIILAFSLSPIIFNFISLWNPSSLITNKMCRFNDAGNR